MLRKVCCGALVAASAVAVRLDDDHDTFPQDPMDDVKADSVTAASPSKETMTLDDIKDTASSAGQQLSDSLTQATAMAPPEISENELPGSDKWATDSADLSKSAKPEEMKDAALADLKREMDAPLADFVPRHPASLLQQAPQTADADALTAGKSLPDSFSSVPLAQPDASLSQGLDAASNLNMDDAGASAASPDMGLASRDQLPQELDKTSFPTDDDKWATDSGTLSINAKPEDVKKAAMADMQKELSAPLSDFAPPNQPASLLQKSEPSHLAGNTNPWASLNQELSEDAASLGGDSASVPAAMPQDPSLPDDTEGAAASLQDNTDMSLDAASANAAKWARPTSPSVNPAALKAQAAEDMKRELSAPLSDFAPKSGYDAPTQMLQMPPASLLEQQASLEVSQDPVDTNADGDDDSFDGPDSPLNTDQSQPGTGLNLAAAEAAPWDSLSEAMSNLNQASKTLAGGQPLNDPSAAGDSATNSEAAAAQDLAAADADLAVPAPQFPGAVSAASGIGAQPGSLLQEEPAKKADGDSTTEAAKAAKSVTEAPCATGSGCQDLGDNLEDLKHRISKLPTKPCPKGK